MSNLSQSDTSGQLEDSSNLTNDPNLQPVFPIHDAILPFPHQGVTWAIPNLGDNVETENAAMAELFEQVNRTLLTLSNMRDCFVVNPPSLECVKAHHNMFVRLNLFIDARTKKDNQARLDFAHVTPVRRVFRVYPVRYFDQKNRWTKRWVELALYGLTNFAQMAEANTWTNDFHEVSATEMKKAFQEAYRLMCVELFGKPIDDTFDPTFRLEPSDFENYNPSALIPVYETLEHPYVAFFTEDRLRSISTPSVPIGEGIDETGGMDPSPGEKAEQAIRDQIIR